MTETTTETAVEGGGEGGTETNSTPPVHNWHVPALLLPISNPTLELCSYSRDPACLQIGTGGMGGRAEPNHDEDQ